MEQLFKPRQKDFPLAGRMGRREEAARAIGGHAAREDRAAEARAFDDVGCAGDRRDLRHFGRGDRRRNDQAERVEVGAQQMRAARIAPAGEQARSAGGIERRFCRQEGGRLGGEEVAVIGRSGEVEVAEQCIYPVMCRARRGAEYDVSGQAPNTRSKMRSMRRK